VHVETSSVLFREMPLELLQSSDHLAPAHPSARRASTGGGEAGTAAATPVAGVDFPPTRLLAHAGGRVTLGRPANASPLRYGWDLEFGRRDVTVTPFEAAACKVSNGELAAFVADGGYATRAHWTAEGWAWCQSVGARAPPFWARGGSALRLLLNEAPMQWDWPAVVSAHEASAYCNWRTAREGALPSRAYRPLREAEHALLRSHNGGELGESNHGFDWTSERPVDGGAAAPSGHHDLLGNLWEHCADDASPLDGFTPHALYPDYSAPAFGPHHTMLVGGSFASSGAYASAACRNYFRPHFVQHAGFRLARDAAAAAAG
jgi:formylglycine-generating enzyme required for sulfatase activity